MGFLRDFNNFFKEWKDSLQMIQLGALVTIFLTLFTMWIATNLPEYANTAWILFSMIIIVGIVGSIDTLKERNKVLGISTFGANFNVLGIALVIGGILGFVFVDFPLSLSMPLIVAGDTMSFVFVVILSPVIEEFFFRGTLFFSLQQAGQALVPKKYVVVFSFVATSVAFGIFHWLAYGAAMPAMISAVLFSSIALIGNAFFKSTGFGIGTHFVINFLGF